MSALHPPLRPFARRDVYAPTGPESADFDRHAIEGLGVPQPVLMESAGRSAAHVLQRLYPDGTVVGVVGAGNNGGDALVLLRTLAAWGRDVRGILVAERPRPEVLLHAWEVPLASDEDLSDAELLGFLGDAAVVVDGILGTGVRGAPRERQARGIRLVNQAGRPVLAIDIPSGVDGETGAVPGVAVAADATVAFGGPKLGSLLHPGRALTGRLVAVEMGFPPMPGGFARLVTPEWAQAELPRRGSDTHKNAVGRVVVVAGSPGMAGAAVLAARGASRAGAGYVQICSFPSNREVLQAAVPECVFVDASDDAALTAALAQAHAVAVGPGLGVGDEAEALLSRVLSGPPVATVADADALNLLAQGRPTTPEAVASSRSLLLTPHAGEMARLRGLTPEALAAGRARAAREAAEAYGCTVLLKGAPSLVAAPSQPLLIDTQGSSDLAVAGMGDVLTGVCAGLMAQGVDSPQAGAVGLYLTGRSAAASGRGRALTPVDVLRWLPEALAERGPGSSDLDLPFVVLDLDEAR